MKPRIWSSFLAKSNANCEIEYQKIKLHGPCTRMHVLILVCTKVECLTLVESIIMKSDMYNSYSALTRGAQYDCQTVNDTSWCFPNWLLCLDCILQAHPQSKGFPLVYIEQCTQMSKLECDHMISRWRASSVDRSQTCPVY